MRLKTGKIEKDIEVSSLQPQRKNMFGSTSLYKVLTWVDASYELHYDVKFHTGGLMSMVLGVLTVYIVRKS